MVAVGGNLGVSNAVRCAARHSSTVDRSVTCAAQAARLRVAVADSRSGLFRAQGPTASFRHGDGSGHCDDRQERKRADNEMFHEWAYS